MTARIYLLIRCPLLYVWAVIAALASCAEDVRDTVAANTPTEMSDDADPRVPESGQQLFLGEDERLMTVEDVRRTVLEHSGFALPPELSDVVAIQSTARETSENYGESIVLRVAPKIAHDLLQSAHIFWEDAGVYEARVYDFEHAVRIHGITFDGGKGLHVRDFDRRIDLNVGIDKLGAVWFQWARLSL
jgi:hypothetical protein